MKLNIYFFLSIFIIFHLHCRKAPTPAPLRVAEEPELVLSVEFEDGQVEKHQSMLCDQIIGNRLGSGGSHSNFGHSYAEQSYTYSFPSGVARLTCGYYSPNTTLNTSLYVGDLDFLFKNSPDNIYFIVEFENYKSKYFPFHYFDKNKIDLDAVEYIEQISSPYKLNCSGNSYGLLVDYHYEGWLYKYNLTDSIYIKNLDCNFLIVNL